MIIDGAFYKLPELLLGHDFPHGQYEATLANHLAMAVLLELNARNVPMPQSRIHMERPYPIEKAGPATRADLYVDLEGPPLDRLRLTSSYYGLKAYNWIEAKFYAKIGRGSGNVTKVSNAGRITKDLLRLCLLVKEEGAGSRDNGRYFLAVFNRAPGAYLAFGRQSQGAPDRDWLLKLLSPGHHQLNISLKEETKSFLNKISASSLDQVGALGWSLDVVTYSFKPAFLSSQPLQPLYWGYLVRIVNFQMRLGSDALVYDDSSDDIWSREQTATQERLAQRVLGMKASDE